MGGGDTPEVGHVLDGPDGEAAVDEAVVHEHVGHPEQRDPQTLRATPETRQSRAGRTCTCLGCHRTRQQKHNATRDRVREETPLILSRFYNCLSISCPCELASVLFDRCVNVARGPPLGDRRPWTWTPMCGCAGDAGARMICLSDVYYHATFHTPAACWVKF